MEQGNAINHDARLFVVPAKHILTEIIHEITVHCMDMIGIVLGIVILNQELRTVNTVIVRFARFDAAGPGEVNSSQPLLS